MIYSVPTMGLEIPLLTVKGQMGFQRWQHKPPWEGRLEFAARSHPGLQRPTNQDALVLPESGLWVGELTDGERGFLLAVADGLGSSAHGGLAAQMVCDGLREWHVSARYADLSQWQQELCMALQQINIAVFHKSCSANEFFGMASTASVLLVLSPVVIIAHVGDSRIYHGRPVWDGNPTGAAWNWRLLTVDHTEAVKLIQEGQITPADARTSARARRLNEVIGGEPELERIDTEAFLLRQDTFLLASDGLTDAVPEPTIFDIMNSGQSLEVQADALVEAALRNGGLDNISVILARWQQGR